MAPKPNPTKESLTINSVNSADVIFGKGKAAYMHPGNRRLARQLGNKEVLDSYREAQIERDNKEKQRITKEIVDGVKNGGGRFLAMDGQHFKEVPDKQAQTKVGQAIRRLIQPQDQTSQNPQTGTTGEDDDDGEESILSSEEGTDDSEEQFLLFDTSIFAEPDDASEVGSAEESKPAAAQPNQGVQDEMATFTSQNEDAPVVPAQDTDLSEEFLLSLAEKPDDVEFSLLEGSDDHRDNK